MIKVLSRITSIVRSRISSLGCRVRKKARNSWLPLLAKAIEQLVSMGNTQASKQGQTEASQAPGKKLRPMSIAVDKLEPWRHHHSHDPPPLRRSPSQNSFRRRFSGSGSYTYKTPWPLPWSEAAFLPEYDSKPPVKFSDFEVWCMFVFHLSFVGAGICFRPDRQFACAEALRSVQAHFRLIKQIGTHRLQHVYTYINIHTKNSRILTPWRSDIITRDWIIYYIIKYEHYHW